MALARETTRAAESDETNAKKKKNKTPPQQNSPTVHHPFSFHCSATCSHGMLRCDVSIFLSRFSLSLSLSRARASRVFFTRIEEDRRLNDGSSIIDGCTSRRLGDEQGHRNVVEEAKRVVTTRPCDQS